MNRAWTHLGAALVLAFAVGLVGCDDGDGGSDSGPPGTDSGPPMVDSGPEATNTIVDVAVANGNFTILLAAAERAGLSDLLAGPGPFTVFAPTDQAFTDSGITSLDGFTDDQLRGILTYHAISGQRLRSTDLVAGPIGSAASPMPGQPGLTLFIGTEGGVTINGGNAITGGANVAMADVEADNGIIHVIDRVLLPPNIPMAATYAGLTGLLGAVGAASPVGATPVADVLSGDGPFTVFAPSNDAFDALTTTPDADTLRDVLLYHVVGAAVPSAAVPAMADSSLANEYGDNVTLMFDTSSGVAVNGAAVEVADIITTNGIVHVIDAVLLPPNAVDMVGIAGLTQLGASVAAAAPLTGGGTVADALADQQPYTIFAPTDDAFSRVPAGLTADQVRDVLLLHVVNAGSPVGSDALPATAASLLGQTLTFDAAATPPTVTAPGGTTGSGAAPIEATDIHVTNGTIHVIGEVLLPGAG